MFRLFAAGIIAMMARGAVMPGPSQFYVVSVSFSDYGPSFYYRILDVKQDGLDSVVRYVRIAPVGIFCPKLAVQAVEARVRGTSPAQLAGKNNPCAVRPEALKTSLKQNRRAESVFEAISFGVVAQCGPSSVAFTLPMDQQVDLKGLAKAHPEMARLWDLTGATTDHAFGKKDIFHDRREEDEAALQGAGEKLVPELISGLYDSGLRLAVTGNVGTWNSPNFRSILATYRGPVNARDARPVPELLNERAYQFSRSEPPIYPPLALQARIQGRVELQLTVQPETGQVNGVTVVSGHPLLTPAAANAAKQWRFIPDSVPSEMVNVTLDFTIRCR
jgi:TonB family protein